MSGNELIAGFMGFEKTGTFYDTADERHHKYKSELFGYTYPGEWAFHIKWDWLMPVVNKIESILSTPGASVMVGWDHWNDQFDGTINSDIEVSYSIVVEFIKWYNKTPNP